MRKKSVYDLAFDFIEEFYGEKECPQDIKERILDFMEGLLYDGFTAEEIIGRWNVFAHNNPGRMPKLGDLFKEAPATENILLPGVMYYHNLLQCMPGAPIRDIDINTGIITKVDEPYFLEMRASLTLDQLVDYYAKQFGLTLSQSDLKRETGRFKWLLKSHPVEDILFMIDTAANMADDMDWGVIEPIRLSEFKLQANEAKMAKITEIRQAGDDKIVTKQRVLSSRRRSEDAERVHT